MSDSQPPTRVLTFGEAVRRRPGMYAGGEPGFEMLQHLIDELISNGIDQYLRGAASALTVAVPAEGTIEVSDDGAGLPFDLPDPAGEASLATHYLLHPHFTGRADEGAPHVHLHYHSGIGIAVVNQLCTKFVCRSWRDGRLWEQRFGSGEPEAAPRVVAEGEGRGTTFSFRPNGEIVGAIRPDHGLLRSTLWRAVHLFAGLRIHCGEERFFASDGLADYLRVVEDPTAFASYRWDQRPLFHWRSREGGYHIDAVARGFGGGGDGPACQWRSWVNGRSTPLHGSHVKGFAQSLEQQGWEPAIAMIHITTYDPRFAGPTRDRYVSDQAQAVIRGALAAPLEAFCIAQSIGRPR